MFSHNSLFYDLAFLMGPSQPDTIFLHSSPSWGMEIKPWCFLRLVLRDGTHVTPYYCSPCFRWASRMVIHFLTVSQGVETSIFKSDMCNLSCAFKRSPAHSWRLSITGQLWVCSTLCELPACRYSLYCGERVEFRVDCILIFVSFSLSGTVLSDLLQPCTQFLFIIKSIKSQTH